MLNISDCDCPDCAPYCSTNGSCWQTPEYGSTPCENRECYTDDDCYLTPDAYMTLHGRQGCFTYNTRCYDHVCTVLEGPGFCRGECALYENAIGDNCNTEIAECEEEKRQKLAAGEFSGVCGIDFSPLKKLTAAAGVSLQVGTNRNSWSTGSCGRDRCRTRTGRCCEPVTVQSRNICPLIC
jgi:hypothetical protein